MKTKITLFLAIVLVAISVIIIYKEAAARPMLCDTYADLCTECQGEFVIEWCWEGESLIWCDAVCYVGGGCDWPCIWPCFSTIYIKECVL